MRFIVLRRSFLPVCGLAVFAAVATLSAAGDKAPAKTDWQELRKAGWKVPQPPYPYTARAKHEQGAGEITVTTGPTGKVIKASMTKKIGYPDIDDFVVKFALGEWQGPPNKRVTVPLRFALQ